MLLSILSTLALFVCIVGIIYPFPPFKTRKRALGLATIAFVVCISAALIYSADPEVIAERQQLANSAIAQARLAIADGDLDKAKSELDALDYRAADQEFEAVAEVRAEITRIEVLPALEAINTNRAISLSNKIWRIHELWQGLGKSKASKALLENDFEKALLPIVKSVPASDADLNKTGYELLAIITSFSESPNSSYSEKAKSYQDKTTNAGNSGKGCPLPNYAFTSQVPPRLKNPSSFKAIRVYMGAKDGQGYQAAYMDYYATNGFGGRIQETATGKINISNCKFVLIAP